MVKDAGNPKDTNNYIDPKEVAETISFILKHINGVAIDHVVLNRLEK